MSKYVEIGEKRVGPGYPAYIIAEVGINHNGDLDIAKRLIDAAKSAGCDAVKFQKRTPEKCVPPDQRDRMRDTPWGHISYIDYKHRMEFGEAEYRQIDQYCKKIGIHWFASCWDEESVDFLEQFEISCYKIPSACLTDIDLMKYHRKMGRPMLLSTGMSTLEQIDRTVEIIGVQNLVVMHCTSAYPSKVEELNLKVIPRMIERYDVPVGYSGHEVGLYTTLAAVVLGACVIERHVTLDRSMWGTDQAASVEPHGIAHLVKNIRAVEKALGDGIKRVYESELSVMHKLRRSNM